MNKLYSIEEVIEIVEKQERLQTFVYCLYNNENYKLSNLKKLDSNNFNVAMYIMRYIYPENIFTNIDRFK